MTPPEIYADTDFFLAVAKKEDWLKSGAQNIYSKHKGGIVTSIVTAIEIALISKRKGIEHIEDAFASLFDLSSVEGISREECMEVAYLIEKENFNVFDAFHAVLSRGMPIASSEQMYDKIGKERVRLEK